MFVIAYIFILIGQSRRLMRSCDYKLEQFLYQLVLVIKLDLFIFLLSSLVSVVKMICNSALSHFSYAFPGYNTS